MTTSSATRALPSGSQPMPQLRRVVALMLLGLAVLVPSLPVNAASGAFGPPDGQGVFDITATVPSGHGNGVFELSLDPAFGWDVTTEAGEAGTEGSANGSATAARFSNPGGVAEDRFGNLFVSDAGNNCIRMMSPDGQVTTIAGSTYGFANGPGGSARFAFPTSVAVGPGDDHLYVSDTYNHCIRKLTRPAVDGQPWVVTTLAGLNISGFADASGSSARFSSPQGLVVDASGFVYVADSGNHRIRKITPLGVVTTFAGSGTAGFANGAPGIARFDSPYGVVLDSASNLFVADRANHRIRKVLVDGTVSTHAGTGTPGAADGALASASFNSPAALAIDSHDTLYVSDEKNHKIRRITPDTRSPFPEVQTVAGNGTVGFTNARAGLAKFNFPAGLAVNAAGDLVVADSENDCLRRIISTLSVAAVGNPALPLVKATIHPVALVIPPGVYYFRWRAADWTVEDDGLSKFITTVVPVVTTVAADPVNAAEATFKGTVNPRNLQVTGLKFEYTTDPNFDAPLEAVVASMPAIGNVAVPFSFQLSYPTSTLPGTVYYFRAIAINDYGTAVAADILSFTVPATTVVTEAVTASMTTRYSAELNATVNPKGSAMTVRFDYSTEPGLLDSWIVSTMVPAPNAGGARGVVVDSSGTAFYSRAGLHRIDRFPAGAAIGSSSPGFVNGTFANAKFDQPAGVALYHPNAGTKILYVCDEFNHCVRKIDLIAGTVSTFAGSGVAGYADGAAGSALFLYPTGVAVDSTGHVYVADTGNHCIRKVTVVAGVAVSVSTFAGANEAGQADGVAAIARFRSPLALALRSDGTLFVADTGNHRICKIASGEVSTLAGGGSAGFTDAAGPDAQFSSPSGITLDTSGRVLVADRGNHRIRRVTADGTVTTLAGSGVNGVLDSPAAGTGLIPATATQFSSPNGIAGDGTGNFWVTGEGSSSSLRKIVPGTIQTVTVTPDVITSADQLVSQSTMTLSPGTTYYYRARGDNRLDGTIDGEIRSFTTYTEPVIAVYNGGSIAAPPLVSGQLAAVDYGTMARTTAMARTFTIANLGGWPLTVSAITVPFGYVAQGGVGVIPASGFVTFQSTLTNTAAATFSGPVTLSSDDPITPAFVFPITGKKVDPPIIQSIDLRDLTLMPNSATLLADLDPNGADTTYEFEVSPGPDFDAVRVTTVAGGTSGFSDATGVAAQLNRPQGLATDSNGNIYVADTLNNRIRQITPNGVVSTIAGTGVAGFADGPAAAAQFDGPAGIVVAANGTLYVTDNHRVRAISGGQVTTLAGTGEASFTDGVGFAVRFSSPTGIAIDSDGILYVADKNNRRIRRVAQDGTVSTLVILGVTSAPAALTVASDGTVYVADAGDHRILKVTPVGVVSTLAGSGVAGFADGLGGLASFHTPSGIALDEAAGVMYVADQGTHRIRKVGLDGLVTTLAGAGTVGSTDGPGLIAEFNAPLSLAVLRLKTVVVGQLGGSAIRQITPTVIKVPAAAVLTEAGTISLSVGGLDPGVIHYFRLVATSVGGRVVSAAQLVGTAFTQWQIDQFGAAAVNPLIAGPDASPAGDHVPNLLKYALGLNPYARAHSGLPLLRVDHPTPGFFSLTINRNPAATNVRTFFEGSTNKVNWSTDDIQLSGDSVGYLPYKDVPRRFLRLGVELLLP
jgi:sugar lactone lactonase YvrE